MNDFTLKTYLTSNFNVDEAAFSAIQDSCFVKEYAKDEFLLRDQESCSHTLFVEKGLLKQYTIDDKGKEHVLHFAPEGWFLVDRQSVYFNQPTNYYIQTLEPTRIAFLDDAFIKKLEEQSPAFKDFNNLFLQNQIKALEHRVMMLMSQTAEERYQEFIKTYPDILLRVPQTLIASYLGITPESLSRVRRELANKNFRK